MSEKIVAHVNDLPGFEWASTGNNDGNFGKICINHESFWVTECEQIPKSNIWTGYVANQPLSGDLKYGDKISFVIDIGEE